MELPSKILEQIVFIARTKIKKHLLIVFDKPTDEEKLFQPIEPNIKQFKKTVTFLIGYSGILNVTNKNIKFNFI